MLGSVLLLDAFGAGTVGVGTLSVLMALIVLPFREEIVVDGFDTTLGTELGACDDLSALADV
jgi:hypothetical protein